MPFIEVFQAIDESLANRSIARANTLAKHTQATNDLIDNFVIIFQPLNLLRSFMLH